MPTLRALTYNVCWDCMTERAQGGSAAELSARCRAAPGQCLQRVCANIEAVHAAARLHLVGLQEASRWQRIQARTPCLAAFTACPGRSGHEHICLFVHPAFAVRWHATTSIEPGRPLQLARLRHRASGRAVVVVHLHNGHRGANAAQLQAVIARVRGLARHLGRLRTALVVCLGDWNEPEGVFARGFRPFARTPLALRDVEVGSAAPLPRSCCSTRPTARMPWAGDFVLGNRPTRNVAVGLPGDASDHWPVLAAVAWRPSAAAAAPEAATAAGPAA